MIHKLQTTLRIGGIGWSMQWMTLTLLGFLHRLLDCLTKNSFLLIIADQSWECFKEDLKYFMEMNVFLISHW